MSKKTFPAILPGAFRRLPLAVAAVVLPLLPAAAEEEDAGVEAPPYAYAEVVDTDGDLLPDANDPAPLVANAPVYWSVQSFALSRPVAAPAPAVPTWAQSSKLEIAAVADRPAGAKALTAAPLAASPAVSGIPNHPYALLGLFGSDTLPLGELERARIRAFFAGWRADGAAQPVTLTFTVRLVNFQADGLSFKGLGVPVLLDGRRWTTAHPVNADGSLGAGLFLRAHKGGDSAFVAEIDAADVAEFLSHLAKALASPVFDFVHLEGPVMVRDEEVPMAATLTSIVRKTRAIRIVDDGGRQLVWRVAPKLAGEGPALTFGAWAAALNDVAAAIYKAPLVVLDGAYPVSVAGWDNGYWDLWWKVERDGRPFDPGRLAAQRLDHDFALSLGGVLPDGLPDEGASPLIAHQRGVWFWNHGRANDAMAAFAAADLPQSRSWLGHCLSLQADAGTNATRVAALYKQSADAGYAPGLAWYGSALMHGQGVSENRAAGLAALKKASDQGWAEGAALYAKFLRKGFGGKADPATADKLLEQAARRGNPAAIGGLGAALLDKGVPAGYDWISLAAELGDRKAQARLARLLREGGPGVEPDPETALIWLRCAAEQGDAPSLVTLGEALRAGAGVRRNARKAADCFRRAAEAGNADGQTWYAFCLLRGEGVRKDSAAAQGWLEKAAAAGSVNAQFILGARLLLLDPQGNASAPKQALTLLAAAAPERPVAYVLLGYAYLNGVGTSADAVKAAEHFRKAAERDVTAGKLWMAYCYDRGVGVAKDADQARKWREAAAPRKAPDPATGD